MKKLLTSLLLAAAVIAPASAQTLVINNGRVITNTSAGVIENGAVVIRDGVIVSVGDSGEVQDDSIEVIDAQGGWITPGLFHPQTQLGLIEVGAEPSTHDDAADDSSFTAAIDVADGFNPSGTHIDSARLEGVTRFAVHPTTGSAILAGRGALADATGSEDSLFATRQFMLVDMSQSGGRTAGGSRTAAWAFLRAAIEDARFYPGRFMSHHEGDAIDRYDAAALVSAVRGEIPLIMLMDRAADIRRAIAFADQYPAIRVIIAGGAEAHLVADELADASIPVIYDPMRNLPDSFDTLASTNEGASILHEAGVSSSSKLRRVGKNISPFGTRRGSPIGVPSSGQSAKASSLRVPVAVRCWLRQKVWLYVADKQASTRTHGWTLTTEAQNRLPKHRLRTL